MELARKQSEDTFADTFVRVRATTVEMCAGLTAEDCNLQAMPETSPVKWHLAHTTWFFETFVLEPFATGYMPVNPLYAVLFNSYYNGIGAQYPRAQRGLLSRPALAEVFTYRDTVTAAVVELLDDTHHPDALQIAERVELGLHHEAQHQELLLTDLKYCLFQNPLFPTYRESDAQQDDVALPLEWVSCVGGEVEVGFSGDDFAFDNETPRHKVLVAPFRLASRLVTNSEYLQFVEAGGYESPDYWLSDGWAEILREKLTQPLYWGRVDGQWLEYALTGLQPLDPHAPVSHVSYYEAQAYAAWADHRLPTEAEWESAAQAAALEGNFVDTAKLRPMAATAAGSPILQLFGDCWEWTNSAYLAYPGYKPAADALGEYNGKFMSGQMVLRGGSCLSRAFHIRSSYRNFFYARDRWQCSGIRLADEA
jgi:ergothioneine biosynthesis protein EgtB